MKGIVWDIWKLPRVTLHFRTRSNFQEHDYNDVYQNFNSLHPKLLIIRKKELGVALINLHAFQTFDDYLMSINGKNSAAYYSRKAARRKYYFSEIDRNQYIDDIYAVNTSAKIRQNKYMKAAYLEKVSHYEGKGNYRYFGVINETGVLVSYCNVGFYGDFANISNLLGHKDYLNEGVMYLMISTLVQELMESEKGVRWLMYDTYFGASEGLRLFKHKLGFEPYRVTWKKDF